MSAEEYYELPHPMIDVMSDDVNDAYSVRVPSPVPEADHVPLDIHAVRTAVVTVVLPHQQ